MSLWLYNSLIIFQLGTNFLPISFKIPESTYGGRHLMIQSAVESSLITHIAENKNIIVYACKLIINWLNKS